MTDPAPGEPDFVAWGVDWPVEGEVSPETGAEPVADVSPAALPAREEEEEGPPALMTILEGMLFLGDEPVSAALAGRTVPGLDVTAFERAVSSLNRRYRAQNRPYAIRRRGNGYEMALIPRYGYLEDRIRGEPRSMRVEGNLLDALAIVAFRQPVTRAAADSLKGGDTGPALRQLVRLGLVAQQGGAKGVYATTPAFLKLFQIDRIEDLPRPADLEQA
jgi:segregation and condensation protein B